MNNNEKRRGAYYTSRAHEHPTARLQRTISVQVMPTNQSCIHNMTVSQNKLWLRTHTHKLSHYTTCQTYPQNTTVTCVLRTMQLYATTHPQPPTTLVQRCPVLADVNTTSAHFTGDNISFAYATALLYDASVLFSTRSHLLHTTMQARPSD